MANDIEQLKDKRFLFVDDRRITVEYYQKELEGAGQGITTEYACSLRLALDMLKSAKANSPPYDVVLIDLHIPQIPSELLSYADKLQYKKDKLNEGQTLGLWLDKRYPYLPYAYLTAVPSVIGTGIESQANIRVIDKNEILPEELAYELCQVLEQWKARKQDICHGS